MIVIPGMGAMQGEQFIARLAPAANTIATATQAAPGARKRLILLSWLAECSNAGAPAGPIGCNILAGVAVIAFVGTLVAGANSADRAFNPPQMPPILLPENTSATIQFLAGPGAGNFQNVALYGYIVG